MIILRVNCFECPLRLVCDKFDEQTETRDAEDCPLWRLVQLSRY